MNEIEEFVKNYEKTLGEKIYSTDEEAKEEYDRIYDDNKSQGFIAGNILFRKKPKKLTNSQKLLLLNILATKGYDVDIYMSYEDALKMRESYNQRKDN